MARWCLVPKAHTGFRTATSTASIRWPPSPPAPRRTCCVPTGSLTSPTSSLVGSFYDPVRDEGCAFEELISFHGGIGGSQTQPFILHPLELELPDEPIVGAAAVHGVLLGWRHQLQPDPA